MKAKCKICKKSWNISVLQTIPKTGYICPKCAEKKRASYVAGTNIKGLKEKCLNKLYHRWREK